MRPLDEAVFNRVFEYEEDEAAVLPRSRSTWCPCLRRLDCGEVCTPFPLPAPFPFDPNGSLNLGIPPIPPIPPYQVASLFTDCGLFITRGVGGARYAGWLVVKQRDGYSPFSTTQRSTRLDIVTHMADWKFFKGEKKIILESRV